MTATRYCLQFRVYPARSGPENDRTAKVVHRYHCFDEVSSCSWSRSTGVDGETIIYIENISSLGSLSGLDDVSRFESFF